MDQRRDDHNRPDRTFGALAHLPAPTPGPPVLDADRFVPHHFDLNEIEQAYEVFANAGEMENTRKSSCPANSGRIGGRLAGWPTTIRPPPRFRTSDVAGQDDDHGHPRAQPSVRPPG